MGGHRSPISPPIWGTAPRVFNNDLRLGSAVLRKHQCLKGFLRGGTGVAMQSGTDATSSPMNTTICSRLCLTLKITLLLLAGIASTARAQYFPPLVQVLATDPSATEAGSDQAEFTVIRIGPTNTPLTVHYQIGGTANNGDDYQMLSGSVTIPSGSHSAPIWVTPIDDDLVEGSESVVVALSQPPVWPPPYLVFWPNLAVAYIEDNDFPPTNRPPWVNIVSPPNGSVFEAGTDLPIVARASDPDDRVWTVEFFAGTNSLGIVTNHPPVVRTPILASNIDPAFDVDAMIYPELDDSPDLDAVRIPGSLFSLIWLNIPVGHHVLTAVATDSFGASTRSAPVEIKVFEPPPEPVVTVLASDPVASEPEPTAAFLDTATFKIHRTGSTDFPLTVYYRLSGTASNGVDYRELPRTVTIARGERTAPVIIEPLDDNLSERRESVVLTLMPPVCIAIFPPPPDCYVVGRAHAARAVILDNDPSNLPPVVRMVRPLDGAIFIAPATIKIAAEARDFDGRVVTVEFFEGTNSLGIVTNRPATVTNTVPPFWLVWSNVPPGRYVLTAEATDDDGAATLSRPVEIKVVPFMDPPLVSIQATDPIATEPSTNSAIDPAIFEVSRTGSYDRPLLVSYHIGGTASNGEDYGELSGKVIIPAGAGKTNIVVRPLTDGIVEGYESVVLTLRPGSCLSTANLQDCYIVGLNDCARAIIRDADVPPTNQPPKVAIVEPENGDVFTAPADIAIYAAAKDPDGFVRTVEFFNGTNSLGIVSNSFAVIANTIVPDPEQIFRLLWRHVPPGGYELRAKATDNRGAWSISEAIRIKVVEPPLPPVVTIEATDPIGSEGDPLWYSTDVVNGPVLWEPPNFARFTVRRTSGTNVDLAVYYALGGTAENKVDYLPLSGKVIIPRGEWKAEIIVQPLDDKLLEGTETVIAKLLPVVCIAIFPPPPDCYRVGDPSVATAYIRDNDFNSSPRVALVEPRNGAVFLTGSDIHIEAVTRDPDGYVTKVEFYAGDKLIGKEEIVFIVAPPPGQLQSFSMIWSNVPAGDYVLTARATDNLGASSISGPIKISVVDHLPIPIVTVAAIDRVASEQDPHLDIPSDPAIFEVHRRGDLRRPLKVFYRVSGTASNGVDFRALSGELVIVSNASSARIIIEPIDDRLVEGTESVVISLIQLPCLTTNGPIEESCYLVGQPGRDVAYIRDNDCPPNRFPTVALLSPPDGSVFQSPVDIRLVAAAEDPDGWVATVEFFAGTNSLGVITNHPWVLDPISFSSLRLEERPEISPINPFILTWSNAPPGHHTLIAVATDNLGASSRSSPVEICVVGPNVRPRVNIIAVDAFAREGTSNTATFRIRRAGSTNEPLTVYYAIRGTASNGVDYVTIPNSVTISAGRYSRRVTITPIEDHIVEPIETVLLRLVPPPNPPAYDIGRPGRAGAVIVDNDCPRLRSQVLGDGCVQIQCPIPFGSGYRIEASSDLVDWLPLFSNVSSDEEGGFVEDEASEFKVRFFRMIPEPLVIEDD
jgi:hypothetical protein